MAPTGLGCMRLSTDRDRDEDRAVAVLHAAFDAGITLLDTADAYCWDDAERGHNERLIARALAAWPGDRSRIQVATKGGLIRPHGRWETDGRAKHLAAACEASCRALQVDRIALYQLHAPDPRTPLSTSVRALDALKREGLIEAIGLCNVTVGQVEEARRLAQIESVQVELSFWHDDNVLSGVAEYCLVNGLRLLAYRPLGGPARRQRALNDSTLAAIARRHGASPPEIALAWLTDLSPSIVPLAGATRIETVGSIARARLVALTDGDRAELDERSAGRTLRRAQSGSHRGATLQVPAADAGAGAEVVMVMGLPGAGKSTYAERLTARGYHRLNRDESGGTLRDLLPALDLALSSGVPRVVLDNTYVSRKSRADVVRIATARGVPVRCIWLSTSVEDAQTNAAWRLAARYGRLPDETEIKAMRKHDAAAMLPTVQFGYQRELEPPHPSEGFARIDLVPFERAMDPAFVNRAVIVWLDGVLLRSRSGRRVPLEPDDVEVPGDRARILRARHAAGWRVLGMSWQPEAAAGTQSIDGIEAVLARMKGLLEVEIDVAYCPHAAGPPSCWCRKPLPGLGVLFIQRHRLDPSQCIYVGAGPHDAGFARRLGLRYAEVGDFFAPAAIS